MLGDRTTRSHARSRGSLVGLTAFVAATVAVPLVACSSESARAPFSSAPSETTQPDDTPPAPTTSATQVTPTKATGDAGGAAAPDDDCKRAAPNKECGVVPQCGCAPTHTCDVVGTDGTVRCITAGKAPMGHPCTATAGCALGLTCIFGTCHAFCDGSSSGTCSQPGTGACARVEASDGKAIPNLAVCRVACELQNPTSCGGNTNAGVGVCYYDGEGGTDCQEGGTRTENQACSATDGCGPGLVCTTSGSTSTCKRWCRLGQTPSDCGTGKTCTGFSTEVKVGNVTYGACP